MIVGTAGHIDHGKTSLVTALTGKAGDRLKEEKARGITIDLGFTHWPRPDGGSIAFVDVPGHEALVGTMLAGAAGVDLMLLAVAADDGVMPQTREHAAIAGLLGIRRAILAVTKADRAGAARRQSVADAATALLTEAGIAVLAAQAVSVVTGEGVAALAARLDEALAAQVARDAAGLFRFAVDRVFTREGRGTVTTGTVLSGSVAPEDRVRIEPGGGALRVRAIETAHRAVDRAGAGTRAALNLTGEAVGSLARGAMLVAPDVPHATGRLDIGLTVLASEPRALPVWMPVTLHAGAAAVTARLVPLGGPLAPGGRGFAQLVLDQGAIPLTVGDPVVLRDAGRRRTIGGGPVLDIAPPVRRRARAERLAVLGALARPDPGEALAACVDLPPHVIDLGAYARSRALPTSALGAAIARHSLIVFGRPDAPLVASPAVLLRLQREVVAALAGHHARMPDAPGLALPRLFAARNAAPDATVRAPLAAAFAGFPDRAEAVIARLIAAGAVARSGPWLSLPGHVPRLAPDQQALWDRLRPLLDGAQRHRPPKVAALATAVGRPEPTVRALLKRLARRGDVVEVARDQFLLAGAVAELAELARTVAAESADGWFGAATFRDRLETGRKMAILILECFDRQGLTVRDGDRRRLDPRGRDLFRSA
jgi:selenocysteine-specific elongation factor